MSNWFQCNCLTLNYDKTHFLQVLTKKKWNATTNRHLKLSNY
jgi:hypothetical protein